HRRSESGQTEGAAMSDFTDDAIAALVKCREAGMSRAECRAVLGDVFDAPWDDAKPHSPASPKEQETFHKLMRIRDEAVSRLASIWNYVNTHPADDAADDTATDDDYEAAIGAV